MSRLCRWIMTRRIYELVNADFFEKHLDDSFIEVFMSNSDSYLKGLCDYFELVCNVVISYLD